MKQHVATVLRFFDLDHPVKVSLFLIEILPFVGLGYAVTGRRPTVIHDVETGEYDYLFERLSLADRVIYLAGEFYLSGHLIRGVKQSLLKRTKEKLIVRAKTKLLAGGKS